jgi:prepilin-type N-terminal cleavage/methylation domain-containing protein/prepilin-type processing-associated H-X9-DG protein
MQNKTVGERSKARKSASRGGFTLIELLVAMAIMGVLVALLLPAVQSVRASARRLVCKNQLRQLGLAMHLYHDSHFCFPPGSYVMGSNSPIQSGWGWGAMILPSIDQGALYNLVDFGHGTATGGNLAVIGSSNAFWRCPSDIDVERLTVSPVGNGPYVLASGNYCGSAGILTAMSQVSIGQIMDGTSSTFLAGERLVQTGSDGSLPYTSAWCGSVAFVNEYDSASVPYLLPNRFHFLNCLVTDPNCFGSRHTGGANFLLADGSLCFINDSINTSIYEALGTPNGGEIAQVP